MADLEQITVGIVLDLIDTRYKDMKRREKGEKEETTTRWATQADIDRL